MSGEREYDGGVERTECALLQADGARCCCVTSNLVGGRARRAMLLLLATLNEGMQTVWSESNASTHNEEMQNKRGETRRTVRNEGDVVSE